MEETKCYDVLKFVEHGEKCYVSTDYVKGKPLVQWLKYHPGIPKEQLYRWLHELVRQIGCFHRCKGSPCYQYVNPFSIIVSGNEKIYLLDLGSNSQEKLLRQMHRRGIRESFLTQDNVFYQRSSIRDDIFGIGKTLQYILASAIPEPSCSWLEEIQFQRVIAKCLSEHEKKQYQSVREILKHFPE